MRCAGVVELLFTWSSHPKKFESRRGMKKILLVEDEVLIGMMLKKKLVQKGYSVCGVCTTGIKAIEIAQERLPDVVVMDVSLGGGLSGVETARIIQQYLDATLIFYTGNHMDEKLQSQVSEFDHAVMLDKLGPIEDLFETIDNIDRSCV